MLKIYKCFQPARALPPVNKVRWMSCCRQQECSPRYVCKQPPPDDTEEEIERLRQANKPSVFVPHCHTKSKFYRNLLFFGCFPAILCIFINTFYMGEKQHKRPKFIEFTYLRIRRKEFFWDPVRTLMHNPRYNALPDGYEVQVPEEEEYDPFEGSKH